MPPSEPVNTIENTMPARYGPRRNRDGSTSGSRPARWRRTWYQPNPATTSTDAASIAYSQAGQPSECPCASGKTSKNMAAPASTAPGRPSPPPRPDRAGSRPEPAPAPEPSEPRPRRPARARRQQATADPQPHEPYLPAPAKIKSARSPAQ